MNHRHLLLGGIIFLTLMTACTPRASKMVLHNPAAIDTIRKVGLAPVITGDVDRLMYENVDLILPRIISQGIEARSLFELVSADSLQSGLADASGGFEARWVNAGRQLGLDALLFIEISYEQNRVPGLNNMDASVTLRMVDTANSARVFSSVFNTADNLKYESTVSPDKVTFDAALGALRPVIKTWQER